MLSKFDYQAPPVGEIYGDPDGVTFTVVQYEQAAVEGTASVHSVLLKKEGPGEQSVQQHRHVALVQWEQFVMQHCLMRLHVVDESSGITAATAASHMALLARLRTVPSRLRLAADTFSCYLGAQVISLRNRGA